MRVEPWTPVLLSEHAAAHELKAWSLFEQADDLEAQIKRLKTQVEDLEIAANRERRLAYDLRWLRDKRRSAA